MVCRIEHYRGYVHNKPHYTITTFKPGESKIIFGFKIVNKQLRTGVLY